ncbi:MAG: radical SAM protein [Actinomycetota bacterium]|nr:radical SAM protein [Actinomycetota bacterium]
MKFELTWRCNLRCGFCYTDSPRHTLARTPDIPDEAWLAVADQAVEVGVVEAVLTGGEPLLRKELVLDVVDRLSAGGVGVILNTNGWFVDSDVAARLARAGALQVYVSVDGATPQLHDAGRGVPGSWRRAIGAVQALLDHGVSVGVVHVLTPRNEYMLADFLEQMWLLGVPTVRVTPVVPIGAAARGDPWAIDRRHLRRTVARFRSRRGDAMRVIQQPGNAVALAVHDELAPASMVVRPGGAVLADSLHPFSYGHALDDGLAECWRRIRAGWRAPEVSGWALSLRRSGDLAKAEVVPYLDSEVPAAGADTSVPGGRGAPVPAPTRVDGPEDREALAVARAELLSLTLRRRYRLGPIRCGHDGRNRIVRRTDTGSRATLNPTAACAMDALSDGTLGDAVDALAVRHPDMSRERLVGDVMAVARSLTAQGLIVPAGV